MKEYITTRYPFAKNPRQLGIPYRINCYSEIQFFKELNKHNGKRRKLYLSIYQINNEGNFDGTDIDCIPFDLDSEKSLENMRKFYKYCEQHNYKSMYMFSTGGFWVFVKTKNGDKLKYPKNALMESQRHFAKEIGLTIGQSKECDIDTAIVGDIARITRAINSKDVGRNRFCIILKKEEIFKTYEEICEIAKKPRFEYYIYGTEKYDISQHDKELPIDHFIKQKQVVTQAEIQTIQAPTNITPLKIDTDVDNFLPCVKSWLTIPQKGVWKARYFTGVYLAQTGHLMKEAEEICKKYFSQAPRTDSLRDNWNHMIKDRTLNKAFDDRKTFPNCNTLIKCGLCPFQCKKYSGENSPIYYNGEEDK